MDFGKKRNDAKKAMKIMWRDGISLKQAWKKVKSGKKTSSPNRKRAMSPKRKRAMSPKRKRAMSPKRKRAMSISKKAMNIMWKEGISLKKAWSKVSRFGDTVCPRDYEPNPLWNNTCSRQQCIKMCGPGLVRNPITNRCIKMCSDSPPPRDVSPGYEINPATGRRRRMRDDSSYREVLPGYEINPRTGRMRRIQNVSSPPRRLLPGIEINPLTGRMRRECPPGRYRDPVSLRCKKISSYSVEPLIAQLYDSTCDSTYDSTYDSYVPPYVPPYAFTEFGFSENRMSSRNKFGGRPCGFGSCTACK